MWHEYIGAMLTKAALPIIGAAVAFVLLLSAALWWTAGRLSDARGQLAVARADIVDAVRANQSNIETIANLTSAAANNRRQRDEALELQRTALERVALLEAQQRDQKTETIERVVRLADGDACANASIPDRLRLAAGGDPN